MRSVDNKALYYANQAGFAICVFFEFPKQWKTHNEGANKLWFHLETLKCLKGKLSSLCIPLLCVKLRDFSDAASNILQLAEELNCEGVWLNDEYGFNEQKRDDEVVKVCQKKGLKCHRFLDQCLLKPGTVLSGSGGYYKVYTPFKNAVYRMLDLKDTEPLDSPKIQDKATFLDVTTKNASAKDDVKNEYVPTGSQVSSLWMPGEDEAMKRLVKFVDNRIQQYSEQRDMPTIPGTSCISPYLTAGSISVRQCFHTAVVANNRQLESGSPGIVTWLKELVWREFYRHVLVGFPRVSKNRAFLEKTDKLKWSYDVKDFEAWKEGRTGFPLVDAATRSLVETGWMHNRLRMIVGMFLTKDLMIDWRLGEKFFMEHLVDGDLASNNGGWQWVASTGTDSAPYFRMFNASNLVKFDPSGEFIRHWIPELKHLDARSIHDPFGKESTADKKLLGYPQQIVDHKKARERVLAAFKKVG